MDQLVVFLEWLSILLGVLAVGYPLALGFLFMRATALGKASALMFIGKSFGMLMTLVFAIMALTGALVDISGVTQSLMRISMFSVAIATSILMHLSIRKIFRHEDE